jgi:hypothetical protein
MSGNDTGQTRCVHWSATPSRAGANDASMRGRVSISSARSPLRRFAFRREIPPRMASSTRYALAAIPWSGSSGRPAPQLTPAPAWTSVP